MNTNPSLANVIPNVISQFFRACRRATSLAALALSLSVAAQAQTTNLLWDPSNNGTDGGGTWDAAGTVWTNLTDGGADIAWRNSTNDIAIFGAGSGAAGVASVSGTVTNGGITFNTPGSGNYTLNSGTIFLGNTAPAISNNVNATIGSVIAGAAGLTKTGNGTLTITNAGNSYTGANAINQGTLTALLPSAANGTVNETTLGKTTVAVGSGGTLFIDDSGYGTSAGERDLTVTNAFTGTGLVQVRGANTHDWDTVLFSGDLSGFTGTLSVLTNANSRGKLKFAAPSQAAVLAPNATISISNGTTLYLNQALDFGSTIHLYGVGNVEGFGQIRLEGGARVTNSIVLHNNSFIGANGNSLISAVISETGGSFGFTKLSGSILTNSGANTYSGKTAINAGTLAVISINSVSGGSASSALGHPTTAANGTIDIGAGTTGATLNYIGTGETSDRVINLSGTTGGATINILGAGLLKFTSNLMATNGGNKTLTLGGATGTGELAGNITNGPTGETALTKAGANTWTLSAATNTFTGQLQVNAGTLVWNTAGALAPAAGNYLPLNITAGGTLIVNGPLRYSGNGGTVRGYLNVGNNAAGGFGTITINSGGSLTFTNQVGNPGSIIGQQGTGGISALSVNGGTFNWDGSGALAVGNGNGSGLLLITNGGSATLLKGTGSAEEAYLALGRNSLTSTGTVYLAAGTLATDRVIARGVATPIGVGYVFFDGGTLKALGNQSDWLQAAVSGNANPPNAVTINTGGAKVDVNGFSVAINNAIASGAVSDGGLTLTNSSGSAGTLTLGGACAYNGPTTVNGGILKVTGTVPTAVTVNPGGVIAASSGTFGALVTLAAGNSAVNLQDGVTSTIVFASGLTLNNGNALTFDIGSSSDLINVSGGSFTHGATVTINLNAIGSISASPYTIITDAANDISSTNGFVVGVVPSGYKAVLGTSGGALTVTFSQNAPNAAYWKGNLDNNWSTISGPNANWTTDAGGTANAGVPPGTPTAVTFAAAGAANFSTVLGANLTINNLTLSTANNVTIGGATNVLAIVAGLTNASTALNNVISVSNLVLDASQTFENNSANPLAISSAISGAAGLTTAGAGIIVMTGTNTYNGGTTISAGTLQLGDRMVNNGTVAGPATNNGELLVANPNAQTFSAAITGTGMLGKTGAGVLTLPSANSYSGGTVVSNGTLQINTYNALGTPTEYMLTSTVTVTNNGVLNLNIGGGATPVGWFLYPLAGNGTVNVIETANQESRLDGDMTGFTGRILVPASTGSSKLDIEVGAANWNSSASIVVSNGGTIFCESANTTSAGGNGYSGSVLYLGATVYVSGSGNNEGFGALRVDDGAILSGPVILQGNTVMGGNFVGQYGTCGISGVIDDQNNGYGIGCANAVAGQPFEFWGANTYHGQTTWTNGNYTLILGNGSALQNSTLNIGPGQLQFDSVVSSNSFLFGGLTGIGNIALTNIGGAPITLTVGNNNSSTAFNGALSDNGAVGELTKTGAGTLSLLGVNTYNGLTTVAGGKLVMSTLQTNTTAGITVNDGTTLTLNVAGTNQLAPTTYTLGNSAGAANEFVGLTSATVAPVNAGTLTLNGTATINITGGTFAPGSQYPLIRFASIGGAGHLALGAAPRGLVANLVTNGGNTIALNVTSYTPVRDVWTGSVNTNWDIGLTANWLTNGLAGVYVDGDAARFDDTAALTSVFVTTVVEPGGTIISNNTATYAFTGSGISGAGGLTKQGGGLLVLGQTNTYNGNTVISNGTVRLAAVNAIPGGAGKGDVILNGTLDLNTNNDILNGLSGSGTVDTVAGGAPTLTLGASGVSSTFNGTIQNTAGTLALAKIGNGTLTLSGNNTYSGATTISAGTLKAGSATALGAGVTTIANGATLDLNGQSIAESLAMNSGATLINSSASAASVSGNITAANSSFTTIGGTGGITLATITHASGSAQFDVTNLNTGTIDLAGTVDNGYLNLHVAAGTVILDKTGAVGQRATSTLFVEGGTAQLGGTTGDQIYDGNTLTINSGIFDMNGRSETVGGLSGLGGVVTDSQASTASTLGLAGTGNYDYAGVIENGTGAVGLNKTGSGLQYLEGVNTYTGSTLINSGVLYLMNSGSFGSSSLISVGTNATLDVSLRNDGTLTLNSSQTLTGAGTVNGDVVSLSGSTINPGGVNAVGTLTVSSATLTGNLIMELNRTNVPSNCDQLSGSIVYGGTLTVTNIGETLQVGDTFQLFPSAVSDFSSVNLATTDATGYEYTWTNNLEVDGSISVATVTSPIAPFTNPPTISSISIVGGNVVIAGTNGQPNAIYYLLSSTNVALPLSGWTPVATNVIGTTNNFTFVGTNAVIPADAQEFYILSNTNN